MAQNKNNNNHRGGTGGDSCSFCGAKRGDVEIMFQGMDGANICNKCIENGYKIIVENDVASEQRRAAAAPLKMEELLEAGADQGISRPVCHRTGRRQALHGGGGLQPLQTAALRPQGRRHRARQVEHHPRGAHRYRQDAHGTHDRQVAQGALHDRRCHRADRGGLCGRGCREHPFAAAAGRRLQRGAGRAGHRFHRRDRQDRAQGRQPLDYARRLGRGRAAGAAEDTRRDGGERTAPGRAQTPRAEVHPGRHAQYPLHLRGCVRRRGEEDCPASEHPRHGIRAP